MTTPTPRSIFLRAHEVRRLLDAGRVTLVRAVKPQPPEWIGQFGYTAFTPEGFISGRGNYPDKGPAEKFFRCPFGGVGTRTWCKEAFACNRTHNGPTFVYKADNPDPHRCLAHHWTPANRMLRRASRLTVETAAVRVKRCQDVTEEEADQMGFPDSPRRIVKPGSNPIEYIDFTTRDIFQFSAERRFGWPAWESNAWLWLGDVRRVD